MRNTLLLLGSFRHVYVRVRSRRMQINEAFGMQTRVVFVRPRLSSCEEFPCPDHNRCTACPLNMELVGFPETSVS